MWDTYGDGWNGAYFTWYEDGDVVSSGTLDDGYNGKTSLSCRCGEGWGGLGCGVTVRE